MISPHFDGIEKFHQPTAFNMMLITDYFPELYSFYGGTNNQMDIYIVDGMFSLEPLNISNDEEINSNPVLYNGRNYPYYFEVLDIWQTQINGYEVLYKSDAYYLTGSTSENTFNKNQLSLSGSPSPFNYEILLEFYLPENKSAILDFFTISGKLIKQIKLTTGDSGSQSFRWNPKSEEISLSGGVYFIKLSQGKNSTVQKVVYSKY
jgi:hypothetical protein